MRILTLILSLILTQATDSNVIRVTITNEDGSGLADEPVIFMHESEQVVGECLTDDNGRCEIAIGDIADESGFIRGWLDVGDRGVIGRRSVIWRGGLVEIEMSLRNGQLDIPLHMPHERPTLLPTSDTAATPTTTTLSDTPTSTPTNTLTPMPTTPPATPTTTPEAAPTSDTAATPTPIPTPEENRSGYGWTIALIIVAVLMIISFVFTAYSLTGGKQKKVNDG